MTLETIAVQIKAIRDEADRTNRSLAEERRAIETDPKLTPEGKREALAEFTARAKSQMRSLRDREVAILDREILERERRLDGYVGYSSTDIIAFRDAQDRAEGIPAADGQRALTMMQRALRTEDRSLALALYRRAIDAKWPETWAAFTTANPDLANVASELASLRNARTDGSMQRAVTYGVSTWGLS